MTNPDVHSNSARTPPDAVNQQPRVNLGPDTP